MLLFHCLLWALRMRDDLQPLKLHLLLAACADMLAILRKANLRTQRAALRILDVDEVVEACLEELAKYSRADGIFNRALMMLGSPPTPPGKGWRIEQVCRQIRLTKKAGNLVAKYCMAPGQIHELTVQGLQAVKDAEASVRNVVAALQ